ncbi:MAG: hypothetical protein IT258_24550 [Saprospiraceae bacterium]|nr:hypothetical protein [Saprospiraceae bacterium]
MKFLPFLAFLAIGLNAWSQNLFFEGFFSGNRTKYNKPEFANNDIYTGYGARMGFGADHFQLGAEYHSNLDNPTFLGATADWSFKDTYYGGFLRTKISRYPAMRFGLVLKAGMGVYNTVAILTSAGTDTQKSYDALLGFFGSAGFSVPISKYSHTMIEFAYTYNYVQRPEITIVEGRPAVPEHNAISHMLNLGLSHNLVFGKRAEAYRHARENWKFRKGWRG